MRTVLAVLAVWAAGIAPAHAERVKLAVLPTQFDETSAGLVPRLFDEYVLAAVQNAGDYDVIGQDDIAAMVGFEKQKDILGCDDASCIANIGGALGVDRVMVIKIARLDPDWVVTSKVINIQKTRVEARTSDMVVGSVKALLNAVPDIVGKLFATAQGDLAARAAAAERGPTATASVTTAPVTATRSPAMTPPGRDAGFVPGASHGRGARVVGQVLTWSGVGCAALAMLYGAALGDTYGETWDSSAGYYVETSEPTGVRAGAVVGGGCLVLTAIGSGVYLNGKARALTGDDDASGSVGYRWLGWVLLGAGAVAPFMLDDSGTAFLAGAAGLASSALVFGVSMGSDRGYATSRGEERPFASFTILKGIDAGGAVHAVPALALAAPF